MADSQEDVQQPVEETTTPTDSSPVEEQTPAPETNEVETSEPQEVQAEAQTESTEDGGTRKRNAQSRIQELLEGNKQKDQEIERLKSQEAAQLQAKQSPIGGSKFSDQLTGQTVAPEDLDAAADQYAAQTAEALVEMKLQPIVKQLQDRELRNDVERVQTAYESLNPDSDNYDASLDKGIAEGYMKYGQGRVSLADYVTEQMAMVNAQAEKQTAQTNAEVQKVQDDAAIRPGSPRSETPFNELSEAEMEKKLGTVR